MLSGDRSANSQQIYWLVDCWSKIFDLLSQSKDAEWLNGSPREFDSTHSFLSLVAISPFLSLLLCLSEYQCKWEVFPLMGVYILIGVYAIPLMRGG